MNCPHCNRPMDCGDIDNTDGELICDTCAAQAESRKVLIPRDSEGQVSRADFERWLLRGYGIEAHDIFYELHVRPRATGQRWAGSIAETLAGPKEEQKARFAYVVVPSAAEWPAQPSMREALSFNIKLRLAGCNVTPLASCSTGATSQVQVTNIRYGQVAKCTGCDAVLRDSSATICEPCHADDIEHERTIQELMAEGEPEATTYGRSLPPPNAAAKAFSIKAAWADAPKTAGERLDRMEAEAELAEAELAEGVAS